MKEVTIELTSKCQLKCLWCSSAYDKEYELLPEDVTKILDDCKKDGFTHVRFSGGEPTLYKHLNDCITYAKKLGLHITLLTNGINRYYNYQIDRYEIQYQNIQYVKDSLIWLMNKNKDSEICINVVNVKEAHIDEAMKFCEIHKIPLHIMKLQLSNAALLNKDKLTPLTISITGDKGCQIDNKLLIQPNGNIIKCASEKSNIKCEYGVCDLQSK